MDFMRDPCQAWVLLKERFPDAGSLDQEAVYALPAWYVTALQKVDGTLLDDEAREFERALAEAAPFGFFRGRLLRLEDAGLGACWADVTPATLDRELRRSGTQAKGGTLAALREAYAGWLVTNQEFRIELSSLRRRWRRKVRRGPLPKLPAD